MKKESKRHERKIRSELLKFFRDEKDNNINIIVGKYRIQKADAEDIFSKSFMKAYRNAGSFKGESSIKTWMYRIIHNTFLDSNRKLSNKLEKPISSLLLDDDQHENSFVDAALLNCSENCSEPSISCEKADDNSEIAKNIAAVKERLSETHRKVLEVVFEKCLSYEEAAKEMGCSVGTIMSRVFYARKNFIKNYNLILNK